ncbi:MAG: hypothetical protein ACO2O2_14495 [Acidilobaceae archaeon]
MGCVVWVFGSVSKVTKRGLGIYVPVEYQDKIAPFRGRRVLVLVISDDCKEGYSSKAPQHRL